MDKKNNRGNGLNLILAAGIAALLARVLNLAQSMATDSYAFVGSAEAEMNATDSVSGELLGEAVDQLLAGWV
jgi:hypothetical protein